MSAELLAVEADSAKVENGVALNIAALLKNSRRFIGTP